MGLRLNQVGDGDAVARTLGRLREADIARLAQELGCGEPTLRDIVEALMRRDETRMTCPRRSCAPTSFAIDDLREGWC